MNELYSYRAATDVMLENGKSVAQVLGNRHGLTGTVIRRSDQFGVPLGQLTQNTPPKIVIDPDERGGGTVVDLARMTKQAVASAMSDVTVTENMPDADRASAVMQKFAAADVKMGNSQPSVAPASSGTVTPLTITAPIAPQQVHVTPPAAIVGGSLFPSASPMPSPEAVTSVAEQAAAVSPDLAPRCKVTIQAKNAPWLQVAYFHQVIRSNANLALVFDRRAVGFPRVQFQNSNEDIAVHVDGTQVVFVTTAGGIEVPVDNNDICILLIKEEHPYAA